MRRLVERVLESRFERQAARRYWHMAPWRSCNDIMRGVCLRCGWRTITGQHRAARRALVARAKARP